jgi:hypothetical protein
VKGHLSSSSDVIDVEPIEGNTDDD